MTKDEFTLNNITKICNERDAVLYMLFLVGLGVIFYYILSRQLFGWKGANFIGLILFWVISLESLHEFGHYIICKLKNYHFEYLGLKYNIMPSVIKFNPDPLPKDSSTIYLSGLIFTIPISLLMIKTDPFLIGGFFFFIMTILECRKDFKKLIEIKKNNL